MSKPYTAFLSLQPKAPENSAALDAAIKASQPQLKASKGLISTDLYRCQQSGSYMNIVKWESQAAEDTYRETVGANCPVGKLIQEGKVEFKHGPVDAI